MKLWAIFYEGEQLTPPLPEYKAIAKYKRLSECVVNLDLRLLQLPGKVINAKDIRKNFLKVV